MKKPFHLLVPFEFLLRIFEPEEGSTGGDLTAEVAATAAEEDEDDDVPQQLVPPPPLVGGVPVDRTSLLSLASIQITTVRNERRGARERSGTDDGRCGGPRA